MPSATISEKPNEQILEGVDLELKKVPFNFEKNMNFPWMNFPPRVKKECWNDFGLTIIAILVITTLEINLPLIRLGFLKVVSGGGQFDLSFTFQKELI